MKGDSSKQPTEKQNYSFTTIGKRENWNDLSKPFCWFNQV